MIKIALALSAILAIAYAAFGSSHYTGEPPYGTAAIFKASSIIILALIAWTAGALAGTADARSNLETSRVTSPKPARAPAVRNKLLAAALLFGALGDALLAWSPDTFLYGAFAFLIGHLFYIALFLRAGHGFAALTQPPRALGALALVTAAIVMTSLLVPRDNAMFAPLSIYTGVLTLMAIMSFTLPATRWLAMAGAVLFFISDGFVAWNMFHPDNDPTSAFWRTFVGWMIYWGAQGALCFGALGLHKKTPRA